MGAVEPDGRGVAMLKYRQVLAYHVSSVLCELGTTADDVAFSLDGYGVRGWANDSNGNPVTLYLHAVMMADRRVRRVELAADSLRIWPVGGRRPVVVPLTAAIAEFMFLFDAGHFPWLTIAPP
jgi:hypothetical protein